MLPYEGGGGGHYALIDREQLSYSDWAEWLSAPLTPAQVRAWGQIDPAIWVAECAALHKRAYPCESAIGKD